MATMTAVVIHEAGGPEVLKLERRRIPTPQNGQVFLIRVKTFGLNRSELFTRQGHSPSAVGLVEEAPGNEFRPGEIVGTAMGGMGREFDGGYAEYTCVPATQVQTIKTTLPWDVLGALPEMLQTSWGLAAAAIGKDHGAFIAATTRNPHREMLLREHIVDQVFIDNGTIAEQVKETCPEGFDKVLELVGVTTLEDSLRCVKKHGIICMTGIVGNKWTFDNFSPMESIPTTISLTTYSGSAEEFMLTPLESLFQQIAAGSLHIQVGKVFGLDKITEAHRCMEENKAVGKIVALV
ncbi:chaperonin 10-like protein [Lipomyces doorenjongii]|uniref:chaperonin 10-like protein n=1 Tax=Lipomyces doorenjongii TaxID=383834 RepID=UPI0034CEA51E